MKGENPFLQDGSIFDGLCDRTVVEHWINICAHALGYGFGEVCPEVFEMCDSHWSNE